MSSPVVRGLALAFVRLTGFEKRPLVGGTARYCVGLRIMKTQAAVPPPATSESRRGIILLEMMVALSVLAVCVTVLIEVAKLNRVGGRRLHRRAMAIELATNVLEQYRAKPWSELVPTKPEKQPIPDEFAAWFQRRDSETMELTSIGELWVGVTQLENRAISCRRLSVEVRWMREGRYAEQASDLENADEGELPTQTFDREKIERVELVAFRCPHAAAAAGE